MTNIAGGEILNKKLTEVFVLVVMPFANQKIDLDKLAYNTWRHNETALAGYMLLGSNGEFTHMNDEEQLDVFKTVKMNVAKGKVLMAGIADKYIDIANCTILNVLY